MLALNGLRDCAETWATGHRILEEVIPNICFTTAYWEYIVSHVPPKILKMLGTSRDRVIRKRQRQKCWQETMVSFEKKTKIG